MGTSSIWPGFFRLNSWAEWMGAYATNRDQDVPDRRTAPLPDSDGLSMRTLIGGHSLLAVLARIVTLRAIYWRDWR